MKRRWVILVLIGCAVAAIVIGLVWPREREPEYGGKKLSEWLAAYGSSPSNESYSRQAREAGGAVRNIGSNALPCLLKWIRYERPWWRTKLRAVFYVRSRSRKDSFLLNPILNGQAEIRADQAILGFQILGPRAGPAVSELVRMMENSNSPFASQNAMYALANIGDDVIPPLMAMLTNQVSGSRSQAARYIGVVGALRSQFHEMDASRAVPALRKALGDSDSSVREEATNALLKIAPEVLEPPGAQREGSLKPEN